MRRYATIPYLVVEAASEGGDVALARLPGVARVHAPGFSEPQLAQSLPLIRQPEAVRRGLSGSQLSVAVLDTGTDYTHGDFGACSVPGPGCRVVHAEDIGEDDGLRDDDKRHGTNVAAIVAGVAPGANIVAIDIFPGETWRTPDEISLGGLDRVLQLKDRHHIVAVNMSIGGGYQKTFCPTSVHAAAVAALRAAGVSVVVSAGNETRDEGVANPACVPGVLSVGAVYDADVGSQRSRYCSDSRTTADGLVCYSNAASILALLAPGATITAGGVTKSGTSMAAPHVAGALALLRERFPDEPLDAVESRLTTSGKKILDSRVGLVFPRLDVVAALDGAPDTDAPTGRIKLQGGSEWAAPGYDISVEVEGEDASGVATLCVTDGPDCVPDQTFVTLGSYKVPEGVERLRIDAYLADRWGHVGGPFSDEISVDGTPPVDGVVAAVAEGRSAVVTWSGGSDVPSGLDRYVIVEGSGQAPPEGCSYAPMVDFGGPYAGGRAVIKGLAPGRRHHFRLCATDKASNRSNGVAFTVDIDPNAKADDAGAGGDDAGAPFTGCGCDAASTGLVALAAVGLRRRRR